jgi:hypothetical protein
VATATGARAADVTLVAKETPKTPAIIYVKGRFEQLDEYKKFNAVVMPISKAIVFLRSPGGLMAVGVGIGMSIRDKGFTTAVADKERCTSACAIAWMGGTPRMMGSLAHIGFHAPFDRNTLAETPSATNAIRGYLYKLGLSEAAAHYLTQPLGPKSAAWLTFANAKKLSIDVMPLPHGADAHRYSLDPSKIPISRVPAPPAPNELDGIGGRARIAQPTGMPRDLATAAPTQPDAKPASEPDFGAVDIRLRPAVPAPGVLVEDLHRPHVEPQAPPQDPRQTFRVCTEAEMLAKWARDVAPQPEHLPINSDARWAHGRGNCDSCCS